MSELRLKPGIISGLLLSMQVGLIKMVEEKIGWEGWHDGSPLLFPIIKVM